MSEYPPEWDTLKHQVREQAGHRCARCSHPYRCGTHGNGEWSPCDERCTHGGPVRFRVVSDGYPSVWQEREPTSDDYLNAGDPIEVQAAWRILTVHHLDGVKQNLRWWNLAPLCQRCHLTIQGKVQMPRVWPWEHSEWFKPYVAGFYAYSYLGKELTRAEAEARAEELLALERVA